MARSEFRSLVSVKKSSDRLLERRDERKAVLFRAERIFNKAAGRGLLRKCGECGIGRAERRE